MDYARATLADRLASGYVAGTLRGPARRRFEALLPSHAALRAATRSWQARLMPLTVVIEPQAPPAQVWDRIRGRIDGLEATPMPRSTGARLAFWRGLAAFAGVAAFGLAVLLARPGPVQPPIVVVLAATPAAGGGTAPAPFVASISADGRALVTRAVVEVGMQPDRALELWAIPPGGAPRSLGIISPSGTTVVRRQEALVGTDTLAVTLEPPGGSPSGKPTGPVLYAGKFTL